MSHALWAGMQQAGWICLGVMAWAGACGGKALDQNPSESSAGSPARAGEAGEAGRELSEAGAGGQANGGQAGEGIATDAELRAVTEKGLTEQDVELDPSALAGLSFTLDGSLCPVSEWSDDFDSDEPVAMPTLHIRQGQGTELEAVTYTAAIGGEPLVEVTPMRRSGLGWVLSDVATCAKLRYFFEDEWRTVRYESRLLHIVFVRGQGAATREAVVAAASDADGPLSSTARIDTLPPSYNLIEVALGRYAADDYYESLRKDFVFAEPMPPSTEVLIAEDGEHAAIEYRISAGYVVGFRVNDLLGTGYSMTSASTDLAGNALPSSVMYPGINWAVVDGSFEVTAAFVTNDDRDCEHVGAATSSLSNGFGPSTNLPPLAGAGSFLLGPDYCPAAFRVARDIAHRQLSFEARLIGDWQPAAAAPVRVCISSLGIGADDVCNEVSPTWVEDEAFAGSPERVSRTEQLSIPLPNDATNLWVEISASNQYLWLDSLRTE